MSSEGSRWFAGIDGGQSSTVALVADASGTVVGRGTAGPCDDVGQGPESARFGEAIEAAVAGALRAGALPADTPFAAVVAGVSGFEGTIRGRKPRLRSERVRYLHDAPVAHAGAFALAPGIVTISGTGSVAYGVEPGGRALTVGGWGYLFGDEGSAFAIARDGLAHAMRSEDDGGRPALGERAEEHFGVPGLRALARAFYRGEIGRPALAGFAVEVLRAAWDGDPDARSAAQAAADALARLAKLCAERLGFAAPGVALAGGTFGDPRFRREVVAAIGAALPGARVVAPVHDPAAGALLLAYKDAGVEPPAALKVSA